MFLNVLEVFAGRFASQNSGGKEYRIGRDLLPFSLRFRGRFYAKRKLAE